MSLKKRSELSKEEKILLLEAIASGEINRKMINENTLFAIEYSDFFLGLEIAASPDNENITVVCLGQSRNAKADCIEDIQIVGEPGGEVLLTLKRRSPNVI